MPELPEVEICRRQLARWTADRPIEAVDVRDDGVVRGRLVSRPSEKLEDGAERMQALVGPAGPAVRHGKRLGWASGSGAVLVHLGMTGKLVRRAIGEEPPKFARLGLRTPDHQLWFIDARRFGCFVPIAPETLDAQVTEGLGPDALATPLSAAELRAALTGRRAVKVALMDQALLAGVGNIQAVEALWRARVHPKVPCGALTDAQLEAISVAIPAQLQATIDAEDADEITYVEERGAPSPFQVYGHAGQPCPRCQTAIAEVKLSGRVTFWCPQCQPMA